MNLSPVFRTTWSANLDQGEESETISARARSRFKGF